MSLDQYEQLTAARERVVLSAVGSMDMEGMPASEVEIDAARELGSTGPRTTSTPERTFCAIASTSGTLRSWNASSVP